MTIRSHWAEKKQTYGHWLGRSLLALAGFLGVAFIFGSIGTSAALELIKTIAWPAIALTALVIVRPHLSHILSGAKIKMTFYGQSIETTLPELRQILEEQTGEPLSDKHVSYLKDLLAMGPKNYPTGVYSDDDREFLRPLRNAGLALAVPRNAHLRNANAIEISGLGRLYLRARAAVTGGT